jgi:hypothetical protein
VDLADLVADPRVEEDPLRGRGLARVDVRHDADVPAALEWEGAGHDGNLTKMGRLRDPLDWMKDHLRKSEFSANGGLLHSGTPRVKLDYMVTW